jgi:hypothetical protein
MIRTHLNLRNPGRKAIFARSRASTRTCRRLPPFAITCWRRSAPGWLGIGNQKSSVVRSRAPAFECGTQDEHAEAIGPTRSPISIARSLRTSSLSSSSMRTSSAGGAHVRHPLCTLGEANESSHALNKNRTSRRRFADLLTADGRVHSFATTKPATFGGRPIFGCAFSNALTGVLPNQVGAPT